MNKVFIVPILSLFLILIPVVGWLLTIVVIVFWGFIKYDDIYKAISETNAKHDTEEWVDGDQYETTAINTKKYKINEVDEEELESLR